MLKTRIGILALTGMLALAACGSNTPGTTQPPVNATTVAVTFANPNGYTIVVKDQSGNVVSNLAQVAPGTYTVTFSKPGFVTQTRTYTFVEGQNYNLEVPTLAMMSGAFYINATGQMVQITKADLDNAGSRFVFYAWLENKESGIDPSRALNNTNTDPGNPTGAELTEVAPSNTQNLAAGYVGYKTTDGRVFPVVGASTRWDILEQTGNVRFSAADDGGNSGGVTPQYISDNAMTAETFTNRAGNENNARFPSSLQYPLYNVTGVNTPDVNGFTWTALNHDPKFVGGSARIRVVAYVNGTEITKRFLQKTFAPTAKLTITKTPASQESLVNEDRNFSITVTNTGQGTATGVKLNDKLISDGAAAYSITSPTGTTANAQDGFDATFDLAPGASRTFTFPARSTATGVYCDLATVTSFTNGAFGLQTPTDLSARACLTVRAPRLTIIKEFVDANGAPLGDNITVRENQAARLRVTVTNAGDAAATGVVVTDALNGGPSASYSITAPTGTTGNANDGFDVAAFDLAAGATRSFVFPVTASADGTYCDTASFTSRNAGTGSDQACLKVATPKLEITKVNSVSNVFPGSSYNSTIVVTNTGNATATAVAVKDLLGQLTGGTNFVNFGSGSYTITGTTATGSVVRDGNSVSTVPATLDLAAGSRITLNITSSVPAGTPAGEYCDIGSFTSGNAGNGQARACVTVRAYAAEQLQFVDRNDPITAGGASTIYDGVYYVEPTSNETVRGHRIDINLGLTSLSQATPGVFNFSNIEVYMDPTPVIDAQTGAVTSDFTSPTSRRLVLGTDYTVTANSGTGRFTINFPAAFELGRGQVLYTRTTASAPAAINGGPYNSTAYWVNTGTKSGFTYEQLKSESTTVIK